MAELDRGLAELARAATVYLRPLGRGRAHIPTIWGSGFFVAPGTVLTCAHVLRPYLRDAPDTLLEVCGEDVNDGAPVTARLGHWLLTDPRRETIPAADDLALVRLLDEDIRHECVWLTDQSRQLVGSGRTVLGYRPEREDDPSAGNPVRWYAEVDIPVHDESHALRLGAAVAFPRGVSGGPLLAPETGAVVGLVKSRRQDRDGGAAIAIAALRRFGPVYGELIARHDRWHARRRTWTGRQEKLPGQNSGGGDLWTPRDRRETLALLAALPPPPVPAVVAALVNSARGCKPLGRPPRFAAWRDGHGELYRQAQQPLDAIALLHYLRLVALWAAAEGADTAELDGWTEDRLREVSAHVHPVVSRAELPKALLRESADVIAAAYAVPGEGPTVTVELDPVHYVHAPRFFWRIRVNDGVTHDEPFAEGRCPDGVAPGQLIASLRGPLSDAFDGVDVPGCPAPLEVAVPASHFRYLDTAVHRWQLREAARLYDSALLPVGAHRQVVLRCLDRRGEPDDGWSRRWDGLARARRLTAHRTSLSGSREFTGLPEGTVPVFCRAVQHGIGSRAVGMALGAGHPVALWHVEGHAGTTCQDECDALHEGVSAMLAAAASVGELPDRIRRIRADIHRTRDRRHWAEPVALVYDDARRPLPAAYPGTVDSP